MELDPIFQRLGLQFGSFFNDIDRAEEAVKLLKLEIAGLNDLFKAGQISAQQFADGMQRANLGIDNLRRVIQGMEPPANVFNSKLLQISYALDDLQYGVNAVVNNIAQLTMAFGGSPGLAGALQIVAVLANQLYKHWDDLLGIFGVGKIKTEAEEMEKLAKATNLTADQTQRLLDYRRRLALLDAAANGPKAEREAQDAATAAIQEAGGRETVVKALAASKRGQFSDDEARRLREADEAQANPAVYAAQQAIGLITGETPEMYFEKKRQDVLDEARLRREREARDRIGKAIADPGGADMRALIAQAGENARQLPGLAGALTDATPEAREAQAKLEAGGDARGRDLAREKQERKQADQDRERKAKEQQRADTESGKQIAAGMAVDVFAGKVELTPAEVRARLERTTGGPASDETAAAVYEAVRDNLADRLKKKAGAMNATPSDAAGALVDEDAEKRRKAKDRDLGGLRARLRRDGSEFMRDFRARLDAHDPNEAGFDMGQSGRFRAPSGFGRGGQAIGQQIASKTWEGYQDHNREMLQKFDDLIRVNDDLLGEVRDGNRGGNDPMWPEDD